MDARENRQWAITLIHLYAADASGDRLEEVAREALRSVGAYNLIIGLTDVAAHMMDKLAGHAGLSLQGLADAIRVNADG